jgi:23S rRNA pseudouridine2605 synthase
MSEDKKPERIAKIIARSGFCSRRDAERLIADGRVRVNGERIDSPALNLTNEEIRIDGKLLARDSSQRVFVYYKPVGLVTSHRDEQGRETVFDNLPAEMPRVISVGRLDKNSEGLLLLTNDGEFARKMELPENEFERVYRVRVYGQLPRDDFRSLLKGIVIENIRYAKIEVEIEKKAVNSWLRVTLREGKNREIRRVMEHFGLEVSRLIRVQYGEYELGNLDVGEVKEIF